MASTQLSGSNRQLPGREKSSAEPGLSTAAEPGSLARSRCQCVSESTRSLYAGQRGSSCLCGRCPGRLLRRRRQQQRRKNRRPAGARAILTRTRRRLRHSQDTNQDTINIASPATTISIQDLRQLRRRPESRSRRHVHSARTFVNFLVGSAGHASKLAGVMFRVAAGSTRTLVLKYALLARSTVRSKVQMRDGWSCGAQSTPRKRSVPQGCAWTASD